jgi:uncharacterized damage-inducible protein DinB
MGARSVDAFLDELQGHIDEIELRIRKDFRGLSDDQLNWKPPGGGWSVGECFEHLLTTNRLYLVRIERQLASAGAKPEGRRAETYRSGILGGWLARQMGPSPMVKVKTPRVFRPSSWRVAGTVLGDLLAQQEHLRRVVDASRGADLGGVRIPSPLTSLIRLRLGDVLELLVLHELRHLGQADRVRSIDEFPAP